MDIRQSQEPQRAADYDALKEKLNRYEIILAQTENVLFQWDCISGAVSVSDTWQSIFGYPLKCSSLLEVLETEALFHPGDLPVILDRMNRLKAGSSYEVAEVRIYTAAGSCLWCRIRASAVRNAEGILQTVVGIIINIDAEKRASNYLQEQALRDPLTGLLNKAAGRRQAEAYLNEFPRGTACALLIIDLDHFKQINDRYGHLFGDSVLTRAAREIEGLFRAGDIVARIGGDEFLVLLRFSSSRTLVEKRCRQILQILAGCFQEIDLTLGCSIGIALAPEHGCTYVELFQHADQALYSAKSRGRATWAFYEPGEEIPGTIRKVHTEVSGRIDSEEAPELADNRIFQYAFHRLYGSRDVDASLTELLALLGRQTNVSRVYIFENSWDNRTCSNTYEWCNAGITPQMDNLQNVSYETDIPEYENYFDESDLFYCPDIRTLPRELYDILEPQGIRSILHCAIRENGVFRGYIGFDDCREYRMWTKDQIRLLKDFSGMLSMFLMRRRRQEKIRRQAEELRLALDRQNAWVYITDPDTCEIRYCNSRVREEAGAEQGMYCYRALMGQEQRCPGCPAAGIRQKKNNRAVLRIQGFSGPVLSEASLICWEGKEVCLMTCREIPTEKTVTPTETAAE